jgi:hypothetical protein
VRVDDRIAKSGAIDPVMIGRTMYFKFTSFNLWGGGQQTLDAVTAWPYVITGSMAGLQPQPGTALLRLSPASTIVQADAVGGVLDWSPAASVATVLASDGTDQTGDFTYSIQSATNVVASLSGTLGNRLTITGWASGVVDAEYRNALIQLHGYPGAADASQYGRSPRVLNAGVSFVNSATPVGDGFMRLGAVPWRSSVSGHGMVVVGDLPSSALADTTLVDVSGQPWDMSCWVRVNSPGASGPSSWTLPARPLPN